MRGGKMPRVLAICMPQTKQTAPTTIDMESNGPPTGPVLAAWIGGAA